LTGNSDDENLQGGPVLSSTKEDRVFLFFVDHGGVGKLCFPEGQYLYQDDFIAALATMTEKEMYSELVFFVEACEAGSMFTGSRGESLIPEDSKMYVNTASNASQSSYAVFCPPFSRRDGEEITTCLADLWNSYWYDAVTNDGGYELSLGDLFEVVKNETEGFILGGSNPVEFGDVSFREERNGDFLVPVSSGNAVISTSPTFSGEGQAVKAEDVELNNRFYAYLKSKEIDDRENEIDALIAELQKRKKVDQIWKEITTIVPSDSSEDFHYNFACIRQVDKRVLELLPFDDYNHIRHNKHVVYMCSRTLVADIISAIDTTVAKYE